MGIRVCVGELVITQAMLAQTAGEVDPVIYEKLLNGMAQLERNTRNMQEMAFAWIGSASGKRVIGSNLATIAGIFNIRAQCLNQC